MKVIERLEPIFTTEEISAMADRYHFERSALPCLKEVCREALRVMNIQSFTDLISDTEAVSILTLGGEFDRLQEKYQREGNLTESYMLECIGMELLQKAQELWAEKLWEENGVYPLTMEFYGEQRPFEQMEQAFANLGQETVSYNEAYMMRPKKSVAFYAGLGKRPENSCRSLCESCKNASCQNRRVQTQGMIHVYCGEGKGKTTAAIGLAVRSAGAGKRVVLLQFLKGRDTSELHSLSKLDYITVIRNDRDFGFYKDMTEGERMQSAKWHTEHLRAAVKLAEAGKCDMLILDELTYPYEYNLIDREMVEKLILAKPKELELVITGRNPAPLFTEHADYITEMKCVRHPYEKGVAARKGIEY